MTRWANGHTARVLTLSLLVAVTACGGEDASTDSSSEPWLDPEAVWIQDAGTPIVDDIVVPEGVRLVGPVFTRFSVYGKGLNQGGQLLVDRNLLEAAEAFAEQITWPNTAVEVRCSQQYQTADGSLDEESYRGGDFVEGAEYVICDMVAHPDSDDQMGPYLTVSLTQDLTADDPGSGRIGWASPPLSVPASLPPVPEGVTGPATVTSDVDYLPDLQIVDGSFLAAPQGPGSLTGGYTALIGVTGDPDEVFDGYVAQDVGDPSPEVERMVDGVRVRQFASSEAGGIAMTMTLNEKDGNAWIYVSAQND